MFSCSTRKELTVQEIARKRVERTFHNGVRPNLNFSTAVTQENQISSLFDAA